MLKRLFFVLLILILAVAGYYWYMFSRKSSGNDGPKQQPLAIKHHSDAFNASISNLLASYFEMQSAFVEADTTAAKLACKKLLLYSDSIKLDELKKDTAGIFLSDSLSLENIKANAKSLLQQSDITEMRRDFSMVNENLYPFLKGINYKGAAIYWQNCPMAFGEDKGANWISNTDAVINPYLGKKHPEYHATMLHCGQVMDSIISQ